MDTNYKGFTVCSLHCSLQHLHKKKNQKKKKKSQRLEICFLKMRTNTTVSHCLFGRHGIVQDKFFFQQ